jgi:hypothetical protein
LKLLGFTNQESNARTFPDKYTAGCSLADSHEISAYVAAYNKGRLVNLILEKPLVPVSVLNRDVYRKAINVQAMLKMNLDVSPTVRSDAADSLLTHLNRPDDAVCTATAVIVDDARNLAALSLVQPAVLQDHGPQTRHRNLGRGGLTWRAPWSERQFRLKQRPFHPGKSRSPVGPAPKKNLFHEACRCWA